MEIHHERTPEDRTNFAIALFPVRIIYTMNLRSIPLIMILMLPALSSADAETARVTPVVSVIQKCAPSVVNISTERVIFVKQTPFVSPFDSSFNNFTGNFQNTIGTMKLNSIGSGVIVSPEGLIITNAHVIQMANKIYVTLSDGTPVQAEVIGTSAQNDLALLQITPPHELKAVKLANDVIIGETVITIGNPLGLQNSVTAGIVSGTNRTLTAPPNHEFKNLIQIDASINPGSSGGAVLNLDGELMGINLAVVQSAQSIAFAIPVEKVKEMFKEYNDYKSKKPALI